MTKVRNVTKHIGLIKKDDLIMFNEANIENHIGGYFESLFSTDNNCVDNGLIEEAISPMVSKYDNSMLTSIPSVEEIEKPVFSLNSEGTPDPDGFGAFFY